MAVAKQNVKKLKWALDLSHKYVSITVIRACSVFRRSSSKCIKTTIDRALLFQKQTGQFAFSTGLHTGGCAFSQYRAVQRERSESPDNQKIMGPCAGSVEASSHEPVHNVHGRKLNLDISDNDGRNADHKAGQGSFHATAE